MSLAGVKVCDGLFVGNEESANDLESIMACKITHIVNCCGKSISNQFGHLGIQYLTYNWEDVGSQTILDKGDLVINEVFDFVEAALACEEGVLIHSFNGESRSCCVLAAYLMKKYRWNFKKTKAFLSYRGLGCDIKMGLLHQLQSYDKRLAAECGPLGESWSVPESGFNDEELLIRNTFMNVTETTKPDECLSSKEKATSITCAGVSRRISWSDASSGGILTEFQEPENVEELLSPLSGLLCTKKEKVLPTQNSTPQQLVLRSALKGGRASVAQNGGQCDSHVAEASTMTIQTRSRSVQCTAAELKLTRFGLKLRRSRIVLEYEVPAHGLRAHHVIKVGFEKGDDHTDDSDEGIADRLQQENAPWLDGVLKEQLSGLVGRLRSARCTAGGS